MIGCVVKCGGGDREVGLCGRAVVCVWGGGLVPDSSGSRPSPPRTGCQCRARSESCQATVVWRPTNKTTRASDAAGGGAAAGGGGEGFRRTKSFLNCAGMSAHRHGTCRSPSTSTSTISPRLRCQGRRYQMPAPPQVHVRVHGCRSGTTYGRVSHPNFWYQVPVLC